MKFNVWKTDFDRKARLRITTDFSKTAYSNKRSRPSRVLSIANNTSRELIESGGPENVQTHGKGDENNQLTDLGGGPNTYKSTQKMHEKKNKQRTYTKKHRSENSLKNRILLEIREDITKQMTNHNLTSTLQRLVLSFLGAEILSINLLIIFFQKRSATHSQLLSTRKKH